MNDLFDFDNETTKVLEKVRDKRDSILGNYAAKSCDAIRRMPLSNARITPYKNNYIIDVERIINNPLYNRYADKTQVFSFYRNDDITRRALHVQLVSRIARNIGQALELNTDLIEAISLGHDIGHTPFGHEGERILDRIYARYGKTFNHNVHSVKVLDVITNSEKKHGLTLQTLDGILCHNGEKVHGHYEPAKMLNFEEFDERFKRCYDINCDLKLKPCTLEGCVVRISDIIAYVGKDRIDLIHAKQQNKFEKLDESKLLGKRNHEIIARVTNNIIKNSLGKNYISMDDVVFEDLEKIKKDNNNVIYRPDGHDKEGIDIIEKMVNKLFDRFIKDIENNNIKSSIYKHYLFDKIQGNSYFKDDAKCDLADGVEPCDVVIDYIASMTDDYLIDIFAHYYPNDELNDMINYVPYDNDLDD